MQKKPVIDAAVIIEGRGIEGYTVPEVVKEVKSNPLATLNIKVIEPKKNAIEKVKEAAKKTGDLWVLSDADVKLIALAYQLKVPLITKDFAVANVAKFLGIKVETLGKDIKEVIWEWYCPVCGRVCEASGICKVCGVKLKRRPKNKKLKMEKKT